jgi:2-oxoglutarate ferredoxin oxidoreductase subunit delta
VSSNERKIRDMVTEVRRAGKRKKKKAAEISIQKKWCKNCGICYEFCPRKVFGLGKLNEPIVVAPEACNCCRLCELRCPEFAVTVVEESTHA